VPDTIGVGETPDAFSGKKDDRRAAVVHFLKGMRNGRNKGGTE
jgi:hypothetical protein